MKLKIFRTNKAKLNEVKLNDVKLNEAKLSVVKLTFDETELKKLTKENGGN